MTTCDSTAIKRSGLTRQASPGMMKSLFLTNQLYGLHCAAELKALVEEEGLLVASFSERRGGRVALSLLLFSSLLLKLGCMTTTPPSFEIQHNSCQFVQIVLKLTQITVTSRLSLLIVDQSHSLSFPI